MSLELQIHNQTDKQIDETFSRKAALAVLDGEQRTARTLDLILVTDQDLKAMKQKYFNIDQFTDVITFNLEDDDADDIEGEIYLAPGQIMENAKRFAVSFNHEMTRVIVHGVLHLCGHEDDTPELKQQMRELEDYYLQKLLS